MGDVLAKGYCNDDEKLKTTSEESTDDSDDEDSRLSGERQAADGAPGALDDVSPSTNLSRLANTIVVPIFNILPTSHLYFVYFFKLLKLFETRHNPSV